MSGGRATVRGMDVRQSGDVACVAPEGHVLTDLFVIECKHERDLDLFSFVLLHRGRLWQHWRKLTAVAVARNKQAMLIAKQNNVPVIVVTDSSHITNNSVTIADGASSSPLCYMMLFDDMLGVPYRAQVGRRRKAMPKAEALMVLEDDE